MLRKLAHLLEQLGKERFEVLIDSGNTGLVKEFCEGLLKGSLPTEMTVCGRTYEILGFLREGETSVVGHVMVERARDMSAHLGQDDGQHLLDNQQDIPLSLRGKVVFVFTGWRNPDDSGDVYYVCWGDGRWIRCWGWLGINWCDECRVLRRK